MRALLLAVLVLLPAALPAGANDPEVVPASPSLVVADVGGKRLFVADWTRQTVLAHSVATGQTTRLGIVDTPPTGLVVAPDGRSLFVTSTVGGGRIVRHFLDGRDQAVVGAEGPFPTAPVLSPEGGTLWVCQRFSNRVDAYYTWSWTLRASVSVPREPIAAALTPDGSRLVVGQHLPEGTADAEHVATAVHVLDTERAALLASIGLPNGSTSLRDACVSPDGRHAFATHILARHTVPTTQIERGWINTNALSIVDLESLELLATVLLDDVGRGAANPWGVACSPDGALLFVTHAGSHELSRIRLPALLSALRGLDAEERAALTYDLSFLAPYRRRVPLGGTGPRGLTMAAGRIWVAEYFSSSLGSYPLDADDRDRASTIPLQNAPPPPTLERRGEMLFHDARLCFQQWQSCASCHPDARADALNWDLMNDGFGNPKNTRSMLLAHGTPPAMSLARRADAKAAVRAGLRHILFASRPEEEARAIDAYLIALTPFPCPQSLDPERREAIARGKRVFEKAGCHECHPAPLYTDGKAYDLGLGRGRERGHPFDTSTLVEVWRTAPYLHDGRSPDLRSVLTEHNPGDRHGRTSPLSQKELDDLVAFLLSL